ADDRRLRPDDGDAPLRTTTRAAIVRLEACDAPAAPHVEVSERGFVIDVALAPHATLSFEWSVAAIDDDGVVRAPARLAHEDEDRRMRRWRDTRATLTSTRPDLDRVFAVAADDLFALRLEGIDDDAFVPAAGVPYYAGL